MKKELTDLFKNSEISEAQNFNSIKISLASPEKIKSWTYGEIKKPETINYRTFRPEKDGLFCARIFGPIKDYECLCGKYKRMKFRGIICEKCGVEVTKSNVRRERMGHINLATPVAHIWFLKSLPSRIALAVDMKLKEVERVLYFENFIVIEPGLTGLQKNQLLNEEELAKYQDEYGEEAFTAGIGAEAVLEMLKNLDLDLENDVALDIVNVSNKSSNKNFLNFRQKINIGQNSILKNYSLDINQTDSIKYTHKEINLSKNSHLEYFILSAGSKFLKHDINCSLNSEYGSISLNGIINLNNDQHHEIKTVINHNEENCKSYQLIKSVLNDDSKGVYQGKIFVDPKAQKTDGYQLSRALLLNENVEFNAKPELEIYADDVKCSHGSTSGNIDENSIFYLMSRGLSYSDSKKLLTNGFLNEVIEKITNENIKNFVKKITGIEV